MCVFPLQVWLELLKPLAKQIKCKSQEASMHLSTKPDLSIFYSPTDTNNLFFRFIVKFFPPDPGQLKRGLTR